MIETTGVKTLKRKLNAGASSVSKKFEICIYFKETGECFPIKFIKKNKATATVT